MFIFNNKNQIVYAWGEPSIWTLLTLYAAEKKPLPNDWNPNIGETAALCFFESMHSVVFFKHLLVNHQLKRKKNIFISRAHQLEESLFIFCSTRWCAYYYKQLFVCDDSDSL